MTCESWEKSWDHFVLCLFLAASAETEWGMFGLKGIWGKENPRCRCCLLQFSAAHRGGFGSVFTWPGREKSPAHPTALPLPACPTDG